MDTTFRNLADLIGSQAKAAKAIGIDKFRAHRLYHGANHSVEEIKRIGEVMAIAVPAHRTAASQNQGRMP